MAKIDKNYQKDFEELKKCLEMFPTKEQQSFKLISDNNGEIQYYGGIVNSIFVMDVFIINNNVYTTWHIPDRPVNFMIMKGACELRFKLNDNIHKKPLHKTESIRLPASVPFKLITYEDSCFVSMMALTGVADGE